MRTTKTCYQQGSIKKVPRAKGYTWEVRFNEKADGRRHKKCLTCSGVECPTEPSVKKTIAHAVSRAIDNVDSHWSTTFTLWTIPGHLPALEGAATSTGWPHSPSAPQDAFRSA